MAVVLVGGLAAWIFWPRSEGDPAPISVLKPKPKSADKEEEDKAYEGTFELNEGSYYVAVVDGDTVFVLIESMAGNCISGHYYTLLEGSDCLTPNTFMLSTHWFSVQLNTNGQREYKFDVHGNDMYAYLDGKTYKVPEKDGGSHTFSIEAYRTPEFRAVADQRYRKEVFQVVQTKDVHYDSVRGYWASMLGNEDESYWKIVSQGFKKSLKKRQLSLAMDIYTPEGGNRNPQDDSAEPDLSPLIVFLHGGAFYVGDKGESHIAGWCRHFASMGYVAVSINYRMGFMPTKKDIRNAGLDAQADLLSAVRYLKKNASKYGIDTTMMFVAGTSAGSIASLAAAYGSDSDVRFKAIANMWGAVTDLGILRNSHTDIVSFHGDADPLVPFEQGYPFSDISNGKVGKALFDKMYGSKLINQRASELGLRSKLYVFPNAGHALHLNPDRSINHKNYNMIQDSMAAFFYEEMVPRAARLYQDRGNSRHFEIEPSGVRDVRWKVDNGFVLRHTDTEVWVVWLQDEGRRIEASGHYRNGLGFDIVKTIL